MCFLCEVSDFVLVADDVYFVINVCFGFSIFTSWSKYLFPLSWAVHILKSAWHHGAQPAYARISHCLLRLSTVLRWPCHLPLSILVACSMEVATSSRFELAYMQISQKHKYECILSHSIHSRTVFSCGTYHRNPTSFPKDWSITKSWHARLHTPLTLSLKATTGAIQDCGCLFALGALSPLPCNICSTCMCMYVLWMSHQVLCSPLLDLWNEPRPAGNKPVDNNVKTIIT